MSLPSDQFLMYQCGEQQVTVRVCWFPGGLAGSQWVMKWASGIG